MHISFILSSVVHFIAKLTQSKVKTINNICHIFRENNNCFNYNLIGNNNNDEQQDIVSENRNIKVINDSIKEVIKVII